MKDNVTYKENYLSVGVLSKLSQTFEKLIEHKFFKFINNKFTETF